MRLRSILAAAAMLAALLTMPRSSAAQRGSEDGPTFNIDAVFPGSAAITGQLSFDAATDTFNGDQLIASGFSSGNGAFGGISSQGDQSGDYVVTIDGPAGSGSSFEVVLPVADPGGYSGSICFDSSGCVVGSNYEDLFAASGTLEPVAPTPEPSGLLLLATGLLGIGVVRRVPRRRRDSSLALPGPEPVR